MNDVSFCPGNLSKNPVNLSIFILFFGNSFFRSSSLRSDTIPEPELRRHGQKRANAPSAASWSVRLGRSCGTPSDSGSRYSPALVPQPHRRRHPLLHRECAAAQMPFYRDLTPEGIDGLATRAFTLIDTDALGFMSQSGRRRAPRVDRRHPARRDERHRQR